MWKKYLFNGKTLKFPNEKYLSYVTPYTAMQAVIRHAEVNFHGLATKVIWDVFTGIGTDALLFAQYFLKVIATETHPETYTCAVANTSAVANIALFQADCTEFAAMALAQKADVAFCDPPWGANFKTGQPFSFLNEVLPNGKNILETIKNIPCTYMIIKSPLLCESFETLFPADAILNIYLFTQQKLKFILIKK